MRLRESDARCESTFFVSFLRVQSLLFKPVNVLRSRSWAHIEMSWTDLERQTPSPYLPTFARLIDATRQLRPRCASFPFPFPGSTRTCARMSARTIEKSNVEQAFVDCGDAH